MAVLGKIHRLLIGHRLINEVSELQLDTLFIIIYYETRTKVHEKEKRKRKKHKENTDHRQYTKKYKKNTSRKTHHMVHI